MDTPARRRRLSVPLIFALVASCFVLLGSPADAAPATIPAGVTTSGQPCAPGVGVTVVVDTQNASDPVRVGCAPGQQTDGFAALTNAGFTFNESGGVPAGILCQIGGIPADGYPDCWNGGFWGYWKSNGATAWSWSQVGASDGPLPVDSVEGWSWTSPVPADYSGKPMRVAVADLPSLIPVDCNVGPQLPTFSVVSSTETLPVTIAGGGAAEVAVLAGDADPATATFEPATEVSLAGLNGKVRILARRAGNVCPDAPMFDATYTVAAAYSSRWSDTAATPASPAVSKTSPAITGWATGYEDYVVGANVNASFQTPTRAVGPHDGGLVVLGDRGRITMTFDTPIKDRSGYDFAVFENGFSVNPASNMLDFLELGYIEVSSNGTDFVRFDSASKWPTPVGAFAGMRPDNVGGLAGKDLANYGTPFDLSILENKPEVRSGAVNLSAITRVRIVDVTGDGNDRDSFGRSIYDPHPVTGSAGFDLTGVAAITACDPALSSAGGRDAALSWLDCELTRNDGTFPGWGGAPDYGLTLDAVLAHASADRSADAAAVTAADRVFGEVRNYVTDASYGAGDDRYVGALSKALLTAKVTGRSTTADGLNLETELRARLQTSGADAGRFSDLSAWGDYSNGFGQTLAIQALSLTDQGLPPSAVTFLLAQQCPAGGFRGDYSTSGGCTDDAAAQVDYTAMAVQALASAPKTNKVKAAITEGADWLEGQQSSTGEFAGSSSNSAGLAAQALRTVGRTTAADKAASWVRTVQLDSTRASAAAHHGAIAENSAAFAAATPTVAAENLGTWRRATAQGVLAFDAVAFGAPGADCTDTLSGAGGEAAAVTWLTCELVRNDGAFPGFGGGPDYGLTLDAVLTLALDGKGGEAAAATAADLVLGDVRDYVTDASYGTGEDRYAGALAKSLLAVELTGRDATQDGLNLETELRGRMVTSGAQKGRFSDKSQWGDYSNGFGQTLAILALSHTDNGVPADAVTYLLAQQCPDGGFRGAYANTTGCTDNSEADSDYTALAVSALGSARQTATVKAATKKGADWLEAKQDAEGAVHGTGLVAGANANTTGLAAQALRSAGRTAAADKAAGWIRTLQLDTATAADGPATTDLGAIAYNPSALAAAVTDGIEDQARDQWRRSTPQAALAFDAPSYGVAGPGANTLNESWTIAAYTDLLGRAPTAGELDTTAGRLDSGVTRQKVAQELSASPEWLSKNIRTFYVNTLGREPKASDLTYWSGQITSGRYTLAQVAVLFYVSPEYIQRSGGTTPTWIKDLYVKILGRTPSAGDVTYWTDRAAKIGRQRVANEIYNSYESRRSRVRFLYQELLHRDPDAAGLTMWSGRIVAEGDLAIAVFLVVSTEYRQVAQTRFP